MSEGGYLRASLNRLREAYEAQRKWWAIEVQTLPEGGSSDYAKERMRALARKVEALEQQIAEL